MQGLLEDTTPSLELHDLGAAGRCVLVKEKIKEGTYVLEYKYDCSYPRSQRAAKEQEYIKMMRVATYLMYKHQTKGGYA